VSPAAAPSSNSVRAIALSAALEREGLNLSEGHFRQCDSCSQAYDEGRRLRTALNEGGLFFPAPPNLRKRIRAVARDEARGKTRLVSWRAMSFGLSAAIAAVIALPISRPRAHRLYSFRQTLPAPEIIRACALSRRRQEHAILDRFHCRRCELPSREYFCVTRGPALELRTQRIKAREEGCVNRVQ
jgi:hypothetical protein